MTTGTTSTYALALTGLLSGCGHDEGTKASAPTLSTVAAHPTSSAPTQAGTPSSGASGGGGQQGGSASSASAAEAQSLTLR